MNYKLQYASETQKQTILLQNKDKILLEDLRLLEGNFLIFSDTKTIEEQIKDINNTVNILLLKQEGIL